MNLYIKIENGQPVDHPYIEDNLKQIWFVDKITDEILKEHGFVRFENTNAPEGFEVVSTDGYELGDDNVARNKYITRALSQEEKINLWVRRHRDFLLATTDWTQMPDAPLTAEKKAEWATYRQQLRDMPKLYANIQSASEIVPPTAPAK